jgi:PilZ domain
MNIMGAGAQLTVTDMRRAARHPVDYPVIAEHRRMGDVHLHVVNLSAHGFMTDSSGGLERGERVVIRLPVAGRIEAHLIWATGDRAGFQFERIIRFDDFMQIIEALQPNPRLRRAR